MKLFVGGCLLGLAVYQFSQNLAFIAKFLSRKEETRHHHNPDINAPLLILHVGPQKTATSTIQAFAREHVEELRHDNVFFLGHWKRPGSFDTHEISNACRSRNANPDNCTRAWSDLAPRSELEKYYNENHTVFIAEENFGSFVNRDDNLWNHLLPRVQKWRVRIVLSYRRHYEHALSLYHQVCYPDTLNHAFDKWPSDGGRDCVSFQKFVELPTTLKDFRQIWHERFNNIQTFNYHQQGNLLENFYCSMLPEATQACHYLQKNKNSLVINSSSKKHVHFDMIAVKARKKNMITYFSLTRAAVAGAIEDFAANTLNWTSVQDFPLQSLTKDESARFLRNSIESAKVLPNKSPHWEKDIVEGFFEWEKSGRFDSVDLEAVLNDTRWQDFFRNL